MGGKGYDFLYLNKETEELLETSMNQSDHRSSHRFLHTIQPNPGSLASPPRLKLMFGLGAGESFLLAIKPKVETHGELWVGKQANSLQGFYLRTGIGHVCQHPLQPACE